MDIKQLVYRNLLFPPNEQPEGYNDYRYERKFFNPNYFDRDMESIIKFNSANFSEIFYKRSINNIYLDTTSLELFMAGYNGHSQRMKMRIRWYGAMFGLITNPMLEIKIRNGQLNRKETYSILPFEINKGFHSTVFISNILQSNIPMNIKERIKTLIPVLLNKYCRKYFLSFDGNYRITIDKGMKYYKIHSAQNYFANNVTTDNFSILELKYDSGYDNLAHNIVNQFPFRLAKSSKYMKGMELIYNLIG